MADIIAGRFQTEDEVRSAAASLAGLVNKNDISIFFNNQPGAHDSDRDAGSPGDQEAGKGAAAGAISGGVVAGTLGMLVGGPTAGALTAAVGAYTGSQVGTAGGLAEEEMNKAPRPRPAGVMLAVRVANFDGSQQVIERLKQHGAADIERAKGNWENGNWVDFDPVAPPQLVY